MFTIIYEKESGRVANITSESNAENLKNALPETSDFIFVDTLPQIVPFRQELVVENGSLRVKNLALTAEQEKEVTRYELVGQIAQHKEQLASTNDIAMAYQEGDYPEDKWLAIKMQRKELREQIGFLEEKLKSIGAAAE